MQWKNKACRIFNEIYYFSLKPIFYFIQILSYIRVYGENDTPNSIFLFIIIAHLDEISKMYYETSSKWANEHKLGHVLLDLFSIQFSSVSRNWVQFSSYTLSSLMLNFLNPKERDISLEYMMNMCKCNGSWWTPLGFYLATPLALKACFWNNNCNSMKIW